MQKVDLNLTERVVKAAQQSGDPKVEALLKWAKITEEQMSITRSHILVNIGTLMGTIGLLVEKGLVTEEEIVSARDRMLQQIQEAQNKAQEEETTKSNLWVPPQD